MTVGDKLKNIRKKLGLSQKGLSEKLKISRGYVAELEIGAKNPSRYLLKKINNLYRKHFGKKPEPLVEVLIPEQPKLSWFERLIGWIKEK